MSQHYSNPERESEPTALPDVETWESLYFDCIDCDHQIKVDSDSRLCACAECGLIQPIPANAERGWFYWFCLPGCLPDSEPIGPFDSEDEALADARDDA